MSTRPTQYYVTWLRTDGDGFDMRDFEVLTDAIEEAHRHSGGSVTERLSIRLAPYGYDYDWLPVVVWPQGKTRRTRENVAAAIAKSQLELGDEYEKCHYDVRQVLIDGGTGR